MILGIEARPTRNAEISVGEANKRNSKLEDLVED